MINNNDQLKEMIDCRLQTKSNRFFRGIIDKDEAFTFTMCNPPFYASTHEALAGTKRKARNLSHSKLMKPKVEFAGLNNELVCEGGEYEFLSKMIEESKLVAKQVQWFTSLVSKGENVKPLIKRLKDIDCKHYRVIEMATGNKQTRVLAWSFL